MTRDPVTVPADMSVGELCDLFQVKNINGAPVVDRRGRLVGVVAQEDVIYGAMGHPADPGPESGVARGATLKRRDKRFLAMLRDQRLKELPPAAARPGEKPFWSDLSASRGPLDMPVRAIMTSPAISAEETTSLSDLCRIMWNLRIHRVPILKGGKVTGLVSSMDLARAILAGKIKV